MQKRYILGKKVGAIGMGGFPIGGPFYFPDGYVLAYGKVDDKESIKTIQKAMELGVQVFDTADVYGTGRSETILGKALKEYRDNVIIATKFGAVFYEGTGRDLKRKDTSPEYIRKAVEGSLRRLQTDYIDVYQLHSSNHDIEEAEIARQTLEELVQEGLIKSYGWSTDDVERASGFIKHNFCSSIQFALNVTRTNKKMTELLEKNNKTGLIRSPFGSGLLTGKYNSNSKFPSDHMLSQWNLTTERLKIIFSKVEKLKQILTEDGRTLVQGLLGWILAQSDTLIPIPGAKTVEQVEENSQVMHQSSLSPSVVSQIDQLFHESNRNTSEQ